MTNDGWRAQKRLVFWGVIIVHVALLAYSGWIHSPTYDEIVYLPAGVSHWQLGRFDLAKVSPPLVRVWAAAPVMLCRPQVDWHNYTTIPHVRAEHAVGEDFVAVNGNRVFWLFTLARWACIPFSVLAAWTCWRWAGELYGFWASVLALLLWCFSPTVLAHASLMTADAAAAGCGVLAAYAFWHWTRQADWIGTLIAGLALGLAQLTKTTWIVLFGLWPLLALVTLAPAMLRQSSVWQAAVRCASQVIAMLGLAVLVINLGYGFEESFQRLDQFAFTSETLSGLPTADRDHGATGNRFQGRLLGRVPVPVPGSYLYGIDLQRWDFERRMPSYLGGQWRDGGWWYYYLYAAAVKVPLGVWMLGMMCLIARVAIADYSTGWRDELLVVVPATAVLLLVSSQTGFNHHFRYVLPMFPFVFIWMSSLANSLPRRDRLLALAAAVALTWAIASNLAVFPHSLSYFNELADGPRGGRFHLAHSNLDWGQDLLLLKRWIDRHPERKPLYVVYFPAHVMDPQVAGVKGLKVGPGDVISVPRSTRSESELESGDMAWLAISVREMQRQHSRYQHLLNREPEAMVGYSIYVHRVHLAAPR